jgi:GPI mannosyltransferase 3
VTAAPKDAYAKWGLAVLASSLTLGAALRLYLAFTDDGISWPDEIYQSLEPAHRVVFGYGLTPWEFVEGARNWAFPGLVTGLLFLCKALGLDEPRQYLGATRVVFIGASLLGAYGAYRLALALKASPLAAAAGAAMFTLAAPSIYFAHRAMSETASAVAVVWGLCLAWESFSLEGRARTLRLGAGASLLGIAVLLRLQCGLFAAAFLVVIAARRNWRDLGVCAAALAGWAVVFGWLDHLAWADAPRAQYGGWFHSAVEYFRYNIIEGKSKGFGVMAPGFYAEVLLRSMPGVALSLTALSLAAVRRAPGPLFIAALFFAAHSAVDHKELRFILPMLPLWCAVAAVGVEALGEELGRWVLAPAALATALVSGVHHRALTFGELGEYPEMASRTAYDGWGPVNRLMLAAHDQPDLCGLRIDIAAPAWTGGSTYLHRRAPIYWGGPGPESRAFNYVMTVDQPGLQIVARDPREPQFVLARLPIDSCPGNAGYSWRLP